MEDSSRHSDASAPPSQRRKIQSHSQQLTDRGRPKVPRKHSLEEDKLLRLTHQFGSTARGGQEYKTRFSDDDDDQDPPSFHSSPNSLTSQHYNRNSQPRRPLPEFVAGGGGQGIFETPIRAAVPPGRPPSLELRPRPPRETQLGSFLRLVVSTQTHLWAGHESGLRFWNFESIYLEGCGKVGRRGDENAAPFYESVATSPVVCMAMDMMSSMIIWSGHKDGAIRLWKVDQCLGNEDPFQEGLVWRAHKGPVLSLAVTSYGDLWSGCEGGMVKVWPWENMEKSLSLKADEKHMAPLLVERSYIDLRTQVTVNGVCPLSHADVHFLVSDNSRAKVWSAGHQSFALWDARSKELLKVFNIDGQINHVDMSTVRNSSTEDETKPKLGSTSKKEKSGSSLSFLQRSRNALMGAADAVRRVAVKGTLGDDNYRTEALVFTRDGMIWVGCSNGLLVQWDSNGNRLCDFNYHPFAVRCLCTFGSRIWVGYVTGLVQVLNLDGKLLGEWIAHNSPVIKMAVGVGYVFTLANHGGIRGWNITSPGSLDEILRSEVASRESLYTKLEKLKLLTCTWNVGQGKASHDSLIMWLGSAASDVGIVVVGLQEVEMGAGFLAMSAAKETVGLEGSSTGQWWLETIGKHLDEGITFERIGSRQLAGLLIAIWARKNLKSHIGDVDAAAVPCGLGRAIGNKGAVGLRIRVYDRIMCFVNCHLAAHLEAVNRRNADFDHVYRTMTFSRLHLASGSTVTSSPAMDTLNPTNPEDRKPELAEADLVVFLGDLNYRLHGISYEQAKDFVSQRCFDWLRERDQLRAEMKAAKVFQGMREGPVTFPPTYKFQRHQPGLGGYDSSEKKRIPAWCDRVLYRDNRSCSVTDCSLACPVVSSVLQYEACMEVTDSDHKPVRCIFSVDIACIDESARRQEFGRIIDNEKIKLHSNLWDVPEIIVSTNDIVIQNNDQSVLQITNTCKKEAIFEIVCERQSVVKDNGQAYDLGGSFGFPRWLQVSPAAGVIKPGKIAEVIVNREEFHTQQEFVDGLSQSRWSEDTRDKVVILLLKVRGTCSVSTKTHRINVCHSSAYKSIQGDSISDDSRRIQSEPHQQPQLQHSSSSSDAGDSKHNSPTQSIEERVRNGSRRTHARAFQSKDLQQLDLQHLNSSSDVADSKDSFHVQPTEERTKNRSDGDNARGFQSMNLGKPDSQHANSSSHVADSKHSFHAQTKDERTKTGSRKDDVKGDQPNNLQQADVKHLNSSSDVADSKHHIDTCSKEMGGKGSQGDNAKGTVSKNLQQSDVKHLSSSSDAINPHHSSDTLSTVEMNRKGSPRDSGKGIHSKKLQQPDMQHLNNSSVVVDSKHSTHTPSTEEKTKNGSRRDKSKGVQTKDLQQPDLQCVDRSSDAAVSKHSFQTPATVEKTKTGSRADNAKGIQSKNFQQPNIQDSCSPSNEVISKNQSTKEGNIKESRGTISGGIQSRNVQQRDSQHLNSSSEVADSRHSSHSTEEPTKKGCGRSSATGTQLPDSQQLCSSSNVANSKHNMQSTESRATRGSGGSSSTGIQPMNRQQPDSQPLNSYSDIAGSKHSSQSTEERTKERSGENDATGVQLNKLDSRHLNTSSDVADSRQSFLPSEERTKSGYKGSNAAAGTLPTNLQQLDPCHLSNSSDVADSKHSTQSIDVKTTKGSRGNNSAGNQSKNLQLDSQHYNCSSDVATSKNSSQLMEKRTKNGSVGKNDTGTQQKNIQKPDSQHLNSSSDIADSRHSLQSTEERAKKGPGGSSATETQPKNLQQPELHHFKFSSHVADSKHSMQSAEVRITKGYGEEISAGIQPKNLQEPDLQPSNSSSHVTDSKYISQSTEERAKKGSGANIGMGIQQKNIQKPDSQHVNSTSYGAESKNSSQSTVERTKKEARATNAAIVQPKSCQQPDSQLLNSSFDVVDSQSTRESSKKGLGANNATELQSKNFQRPDSQHLNSSSEASNCKHNSQSTGERTERRPGHSLQNVISSSDRVPTTTDNTKHGAREDSTTATTEIPWKTLQQPDANNNSIQHRAQKDKTTGIQSKTLHHHNCSSNVTDTQYKSHAPPIEEKGQTGSQRVASGGIQSKFESQHNLHIPSVDKKSKNESQRTNSRGVESKNSQEVVSEHSNSSSSASGNQHGLYKAIEERSRDEEKTKTSIGTQSKAIQHTGLQHPNNFANATNNKHSLHTSSIEEISKFEAERDSRGGSSKTSQQADLQQPKNTSNTTDNQRSLCNPSTEKSSINESQKKNVGEKESKIGKQQIKFL